MSSTLRRLSKPLFEWSLPVIEQFTGFHTAPGDYLPNRIKMLIGTYESAEVNLMKRFLSRDQTIIDVGANVGYLTRFFARSTGPGGRVFAFEPNPLVFPLLQRNVSQFKQVSVYNIGLSIAAAELPLFFAGSDHSVASFAREYPLTHVFYQRNSCLDSIGAKLAAGDEFLAKIDISRIDILKIDVEGWELNVLNGLERTIGASPSPIIFCEFNPSAQECAGRRKTELLNWFLDRRFQIAYASNHDLPPIPQSSVNDFISRVGPGCFATLFAWRS